MSPFWITTGGLENVPYVTFTFLSPIFSRSKIWAIKIRRLGRACNNSARTFWFSVLFCSYIRATPPTDNTRVVYFARDSAGRILFKPAVRFFFFAGTWENHLTSWKHPNEDLSKTTIFHRWYNYFKSIYSDFALCYKIYRTNRRTPRGNCIQGPSV